MGRRVARQTGRRQPTTAVVAQSARTWMPSRSPSSMKIRKLRVMPGAGGMGTPASSGQAAERRRRVDALVHRVTAPALLAAQIEREHCSSLTFRSRDSLGSRFLRRRE